MADVRPFKGLIYSEKVNIEDVVAPPYDVINEAMQDELYKKSPYNIVRLILGKEFEGDNETYNRYTRAKEFLNEWIKSGILRETDKEYFFLYQQKFQVEGNIFTRSALVARVRLEEFERKIIIPHEKTLSAPKEDRLKLMKATQCNLSPVFGIVLEEGKIYKTVAEASSQKLFSFTDENNVTHIFSIIDPAINPEIQKLFKNKQILIADGHHRYETALNYKKEMMKMNPHHTGEEAYNFVMMAIVSSKDEGLLVLPIHRTIKNISEKETQNIVKKIKKIYGEVTPIDKPESVNSMLKRFGKRHFAAIYEKGKRGFIFKIQNESEKLDVEVLHDKVVKEIIGITEKELEEKTKVEYFKNITEALRYLENKKGHLILSYNPPSVEEIAQVSLKERKMPQKSTYFYPKFYSGLIIYRLN